MHRWLPLGRDLGQTLNLYPYVLAYTHKAISVIFPNVTLYHVTFYMPVLCFCIGLGALCLFLYYTYGLLFSSIVGVLLVTLPGSIERSTAGFGDRDAWYLMIGILTVVTYLISLQVQDKRFRLLWTIISGFITFLGGMSWEGFGVFISIIFVVELWRFLTNEKEEGLLYYLFWVLTFVPMLWLASPAYRSGYGFSQHIAAFVFVPPVMILLFRSCRHLFLNHTPFAEKLRPHGRSLALGLTLVGLTLAAGYVLTQLSTFESTTVPLSNSSLMQAMTELRSPGYRYWVIRYGSIFIIGSLGFVLIPIQLWKKQGFLLSIPIALFILFSFFRQQGDNLWGEPFGNTFFGIALAGCALALIGVAWWRRTQALSELVFIAITAWFLVWVALSRDAKRYDFFIGLALAFGTTALILLIAQTLSERLRSSVYVSDRFRENIKANTLKTGAAVILLITIMWLPTNTAHTYRTLYAAKEMRDPLPGGNRVNTAFLWMKKFLVPKAKETPIVAAHWGYGSQLNVFTGVKTITDQDTYIPHWVHLYYKYVHNASGEREALGYLKTHGATHLMLTGKDPKKSFLRRQLSDAFVPIYPSAAKFKKSWVKIWRIQYPPDIETDDKYLATEPEK